MRILKQFALFILFSFVLTSLLFAQNGNEWIDPSQTYYKIWVHEDGVYRVSYAELENAGFPINSINPQHLQLWFRGEQRAIWVEGQTDGSFDNSDYIEFYGQKNDGTLDAELFTATASDHIEPTFNFFSDQTAYFLTFSLSGSNGIRMEEFYLADSTSTPLSHHIESVVNINTNRSVRNFALGEELPNTLPFNTNGGNYSDFRDARGYSTVAFSTAGAPARVNIRNYVAGTSTNSTLRLKITGRYRGKHEIRTFNANSNRELDTIKFVGYRNGEMISTVLPSEMPASGNGTMGIGFQILDAEPLISNEAISYSGLFGTYPQATNAESSLSKVFTLPNSGATSRLLISNPPANARLFDFTDPNRIVRIGRDYLQSGQLNAIVSNTISQRKVLMTAQIKSIDSVKLVPLIVSPLASAQYIIIYHKDLTQPSANYTNPIQAYIDYRTSAIGGNYQVLAKEINELYDEFTYGEVNPIAMRRFMDYLFDNGANPEYLFIIGTGLELTYQYERSKGSYNFKKSLVPCLGLPCSDNIITQGLNGSHSYVAAVPTGRLSARNSQQVENYLEKILEHEQHEFNSFERKDMVFLTGGLSDSERIRMNSYGNFFKNTIENKYLGGKGRVISKKTTFSVELVDIADLVNNGIGMINFFGHSSPGILDIDIGYVTDPNNGYSNQGKYPLIWVNGCDAGAMFTPNETLGENWTLADKKGAVLYVAHADLGFENTLRIYTDEMLNTIYGDSSHIDLTFGKALHETKREMARRFPNDPLVTTHVQQFALQGDPALKFFGTDKAEYYVDDTRLFIEPADLSGLVRAASDSFKIGVSVDNYGAVNSKQFAMSLKRTFNNGEEKIYPSQLFDPVFYNDSLFYIVRNTDTDKEKAIGLNRFEITIDAGDSIPETNENTNVAVIDYFFTNNSVQIVSPAEFSIVNSQPVRLIAQNANALTDERLYTFQLDTTDQFNSPAFQETSVSAGLLPTWSVNLLSDNNTDSIVYYWRVRFTNPTPFDDANWSDASFLYIQNGPTGWSQSHFPQFKKDPKINLIDNQDVREWQFSTDTISISLQTVGNAHPIQTNNSIFYNDFPFVSNAIEDCGANSVRSRTKDNLLLIPINAETGEAYNPMITFDFGFQSYVCGNGPEKPVGRIPGNSFLYFKDAIDSMKVGDYAILMSSGNVRFDNLNTNAIQTFQRLGFDITQFGNAVKNGEPFIGVGRKELPGYVAEFYGPDRTSTIPGDEQELTHTFQYILDVNSSVTSTIIGPSQGWRQVVSHFSGYDSPSDSVKLDLLGINSVGVETLLMEDLHKNPVSDISAINATQYPFVKLRTNLIDNDLNTAIQMNKWQVLYEPYPEGTFYALKPNSANNPTELQEGEEASYDFVFKNLSGQAFLQPIIVEYQVKKENNSIITLYDTLSALNAYDSIRYSKDFSTLGFAGANVMTAFANPYLQNEQNYANNVLQQFFNVKQDSIHPVLDVVFDGKHIYDGEIVSASPVITISGKDENTFLSLNDTSHLQVFLASSAGNYEPVNLNGGDITWTSKSINEFRLDYKPENLPDGIYTLRVQLEDATENQSGVEPYEISFEVINKSTITHFYPYPNPFSTSVRFVFTLTGDKIPDELKIQIMTVTGRVVREITQDEIGAIRIGNNISEYAWDGKDEFGDQLANGVYLYRVITRHNGQEIERRATAKDGLFKKGFGKMYLLR